MPLDQPPDPSAIVVTAARLPPSPAEAVFSITRLPEEDLTVQPRLAEALSQVPGVALFRRTSSAAANPTTEGLSLRSIGPTGAGRALVTLDGVPQNDPFGGWVIWSAIPNEALSGVEVIRGAGAGPYGAGALTGTVALNELSRPGEVRADGYVGGLGDRRAAAATAQTLGPGEIFLDGSTEHSDGWIPVRNGRGAADDALSLDDWSVAARWQAPLGRGLLAVHVGAYDEQRDSGLVGATSDANGEDVSATLAAQPGDGVLGYRLQAWARASNLQNSSVSVAADRSSTTPANDQYDVPALGWGLNGALRGGGGDSTWEVGADLRAAQGESHELFRFIGDDFTRRRDAGGQSLVGGVYAEWARQIGAWLLAGGVRLDGWATLAGHRIETDLATGLPTLVQDPADRSGLVPTARFGVRRDLGGGFYARAAAYSGFRPPTLNELYRPFRVGNDVTEANAELKPERLYGVEAAVGAETPIASVDVTGFLNRISSPVTNVTIGVGPGTFPDFPQAGFIPAGGTLRQRQNVGDIDAAGVEASASRHWGEAFSLRVAADYTYARVDGGTTAPQLTGLRPAQAPRLTLTASGQWRPIARLTLSAEARFEGERYDDDQNTRRLAPGGVVDVRADWALTKELSAYVAADNLFDASVETALTGDSTYSYDAPRVVRVGFTYRN